MKLLKKSTIILDHFVPVYDLQIDKNHNFVLANGCVVHNSKDTCDAACGICKSILDNLELFKQVSQKYALEATTKLYQELYNKEPVVQQLENRIKGLFK